MWRGILKAESEGKLRLLTITIRVTGSEGLLSETLRQSVSTQNGWLYWTCIFSTFKTVLLLLLRATKCSLHWQHCPTLSYCLSVGLRPVIPPPWTWQCASVCVPEIKVIAQTKMYTSRCVFIQPGNLVCEVCFFCFCKGWLTTFALNKQTNRQKKRSLLAEQFL